MDGNADSYAPSKPNVNEGFTVDFSENRLYTFRASFSLVYAHARAANHGTGRRVRESVFLAYYPFLRFSLAKGKEYRAEEKVPSTYIISAGIHVSRARARSRAHVCRRVSASIVGICDV